MDEAISNVFTINTSTLNDVNIKVRENENDYYTLLCDDCSDIHVLPLDVANIRNLDIDFDNKCTINSANGNSTSIGTTHCYIHKLLFNFIIVDTIPHIILSLGKMMKDFGSPTIQYTLIDDYNKSLTINNTDYVLSLQDGVMSNKYMGSIDINFIETSNRSITQKRVNAQDHINATNDESNINQSQIYVIENWDHNHFLRYSSF